MINFTVHGVGEPRRPLEEGEDRVWLTEHTFENILDELMKFDDFVLTVDDANRSDVEIVLPALHKRNMRAIFFIPAGMLGQNSYLGRQDVKTLVVDGMEVGTHGMCHRDWRLLDNNALSTEIRDSKKILEDIICQEIRKVSCPYGSYNRRILRYLQNENFQKVYTSDRGQAKNEWWIQPRNTLHADDNPRSLSTIMTRPESLGKCIVRNCKMFIKRWR